MMADYRCASSPGTLPVVSVVVACYNEAKFIAACLDSILSSDYSGRIEVLVVDGMSTDGTRNIVLGYACRYGVIRLLDNPRRITPVAFNIGIRNASGDLVMIMSAHATYERSAIRKCVAYSGEYGAENVGGICRTQPRDKGIIASAIGLVLSHQFGVGGALFRTGKLSAPRWADTAAFGCYRRDIFERIGLYNEELIYSQDLELNLRLRHAGGRTLLAPDVVINYSARSDLRSFWKHNYRNGKWAIIPLAHSTVMPVRARHLVPLAFVSSLIVSLALTLVVHSFAFVALTIAAAYLCATMIASFELAWRASVPAYIIVLPLVFVALHVPYGFGSLSGLFELLFSEHRAKVLMLVARFARR